jgi:hypothetical protein
MKRLVVVLAAAALALGAPAYAAQAASDGDLAGQYSVLTPDQIGVTEPAQGFLPYFVGVGGSSRGSGIGLGGLAPTTLGTSAVFNGLGGCGIFSSSYCPFFASSPFSSTFLSQGFNLAGVPPTAGLSGLGGLGHGNINTLGLGNVNTLGLNNVNTLGILGTGLGTGANLFGSGLNGGFLGGLGFNPFLGGLGSLGGLGTRVTLGANGQLVVR